MKYDTLQAIADRLTISDFVVRYFVSLDHNDWQTIRDSLDDSFELDFSQLFGQPRAVVDSDEFVAFGEHLMSGFVATQHLSPNHLVEVDGDTARVTAYMHAWHKLSDTSGVDNCYVLRGTYDIGMRRRGDGWCITRLHMQVWDEVGDKSGFRLTHDAPDPAEPLAP